MMSGDRKVSRRKDALHPPLNAGQAADYLADVLPALAGIADRAGLGELAFLIEMAMIEAANQRQHRRKSG
ncbi:hypothetical protein [Lutibaculum baratangense]|nr:hypothetical protein [Lutibaculum baratangense]